MDTFGTIDAYVYLEWNKNRLRTKTVTMKDNLVEWKEEMLIPIELPASNDEIVFKLYDHDPTFDDIVASFKFSIKDIVKKCKKNQKPGEDRGYQM